MRRLRPSPALGVDALMPLASLFALRSPTDAIGHRVRPTWSTLSIDHSRNFPCIAWYVWHFRRTTAVLLYASCLSASVRRSQRNCHVYSVKAISNDCAFFKTISLPPQSRRSLVACFLFTTLSCKGPSRAADVVQCNESCEYNVLAGRWHADHHHPGWLP